MGKLKLKLMSLYVAIGMPVILTNTALAATTGGSGVSNVETFIKSVITVITGLAGLVATGFIVVGGFHYIISSGNPERMDRAKRTITFSALGLAISIAAFVISNIVTNLANGAFGG